MNVLKINVQDMNNGNKSMLNEDVVKQIILEDMVEVWLESVIASDLILTLIDNFCDQTRQWHTRIR